MTFFNPSYFSNLLKNKANKTFDSTVYLMNSTFILPPNWEF